ncbi:putative SLAIN motif-containing protein 1-like [Xyrichtys novacula]|uniref:Small ribosomal subunit protein uS9m n=1 Tax=Xyrichtys novacula TaxID=13765 RepID=A0AAV1HSM7_XYRNO|nr:putative SLAIN motif-containing protein 1-like [Xyrichtys novacula]
MAASCVRTVGSFLGKYGNYGSNINTVRSHLNRQVLIRQVCVSSALHRKNLAAAGPERFTKEFVEKQVEEFNVGKRHLANIMGEDPETFTQEDVDRSISYLFPSGLFEKRARPLMKHPEEIFPQQRAVQWGADGRPFHFLFYTGKQSFYSLMHDTYGRILNIEKRQDRLRAKGLFDPKVKPVSLGAGRWLFKEELEDLLVEAMSPQDYDRFIQLMERLLSMPYNATQEEFILRYRRQLEVQSRKEMVPALQRDERGVAFSTAEGRRKTSKSSVVLRDCGSGKITINGQDYLQYLPVLQDREQLMFPLQFTGSLGRFDLECTVSGGGRSGQAGALRFAVSQALLSFLSEREVETMRQAGLLTPDPRVKKLQELVRKLERQNEQLRTRAGGGVPPTGPPSSTPAAVLKGGFCRTTLLCQPGLGSLESPEEEPFQYFHHPHSGGGGGGAGEEEEEEEEQEESVLDELDLLDLDSLSCSDQSEETWLYVSPKAQESSEDSLSPLQWCRKVLDGPKSDVEAARRSLSLRLEQVSRWRCSLSGPTSSSPGPPPPPPPPLSRVAGVSPLSVSPLSASPPVKPCSTPSSERHAPPLSSSPLHAVLHRTLSPVGKELSPVAERTPTFLPHSRSRGLRRSAFSPQTSVDGDPGASESEDDSILLGYKLQDLTDVQVMARLQEESLRQDLASTSSILANRRSQSFTFPSFSLGAAPGLEEEDEEEDDEDYGLLPPPQPRLTRLPHSHTFSSIRDWRRSTSSLCTPPSTPSTLTGPSAGSAFLTQTVTQLQGLQGLGLGGFCGAESQGFRPGSDKLRRSMPNLVRTPSMPSVPIPTNPSASPLLRNSQSFDSSSGLSRLQSSIPSPGQPIRVQSVGNFTSMSQQPLKATAYVSPTIKGSASMPTSTSLQSLNSSGVGANSGIPLLSKQHVPASAPTTPRSGLPRPASFIATTSSTPRGKMAQPARSLLTPPKSLSTFSALRDGAWRDGCY